MLLRHGGGRANLSTAIVRITLPMEKRTSSKLLRMDVTVELPVHALETILIQLGTKWKRMAAAAAEQRSSG